MKLLIALIILGLVQLEAFRVPLPYGTGVHDNIIPNKGIVDQAIFNRLWSAMKPFIAVPKDKDSRRKCKLPQFFYLLLKVFCKSFFLF